MHPETSRVQALTLGVVDQVVKSPNKDFGHFSMGALETIDGIKHVALPEEHECVFGSGWKGGYFLMEVMMYFLCAEMVTLGIS